MIKFLKRFLGEEDGAEMVEWAIVIAIAAVIAVPVLALVKTASGKVNQANELISDIDPADYISNGTASTAGGAAGTGAAAGGAVGIGG